MNKKDRKKLLEKTLEKFKTMSHEDAEKALRKMFKFESEQEDKFLIVFHTEGSAFCSVIPVPKKPDYPMINDNIQRLLNIVGSLNKKNGYR